jgi:phosphatidylglycerophosphatase C
MTNKTTIAVFDFDHTITDRDSFLYFLFFSKGVWRSFLFFLMLSPFFLAYAVGIFSRKKIKEKILTCFFKGESFKNLKKVGQAYVDQRLDSYLKPEAMNKLAWHQSQGHRCILISASFTFYLHQWCIRHKLEKVLSSEAETSDGFLTGHLQGENCWGPEKKKRLLDYVGDLSNTVLYVYGDSLGDRDILEIADFPFYCKFQ